MASLRTIRKALLDPAHLREAILRRKITFDVARGARSRTRAFRGPVELSVSVSNRCNYGCIMCWTHPRFVDPENPYIDAAERVYNRENPGADRTRALMDLETFRRLARDAAAMGTRLVSIIGMGEPLLNPHLTDMIETVKNEGMRCSLVSNGSLLDHDKIDSFISLGLDELDVSLNAASHETYNRIHGKPGENNIDKITGLIAYACEEKKRRGAVTPLISLSFIIMNVNCHEAADMARIAARCGVDQICFSTIYPYDGTAFLLLNSEQKSLLVSGLDIAKSELDRHGINHNIERLKESHAKKIDTRYPTRDYYRQFPCYAGWVYSVVMADGTVNPCYQCYINMGNVRETGFAEIWNSREYQDFREKTISLPRRGGKLPECLCDNCCFANRNADTHASLALYRKLLLL